MNEDVETTIYWRCPNCGLVGTQEVFEVDSDTDMILPLACPNCGHSPKVIEQEEIE